MKTNDDCEVRRLRQANEQARASLHDAIENLRKFLDDEAFISETPLEVEAAMNSAERAMVEAIRLLQTAAGAPASLKPRAGGPTRRQGQFLAFIREYMNHNAQGLAPRHIDFRQFFQLTPPSVNSMLARLEQRGFIRRVAGTARGIELILDAEEIPPLERPFKFR